MRERCRDPVVNEDQTFTVVFGAEEEKLAEGGVWVGTYAEGGWIVRLKSGAESFTSVAYLFVHHIEDRHVWCPRDRKR